MSDRLDELRRQRELLREHLAQVERELAAQEATSGARPSPIPSGDSDAEALLAEYRKPTASIARDTRFGCILYFVVALLLCAAAVAAFYFAARPGRGH